MRCEICGCDPKVIVILPIHRPDGCLDTLVCQDCAQKSGAYCLKHDRPHLGFEDGTTGCKLCIEEAVRKQGEFLARRFRQVLGPLIIQKEWLPLFYWAETVEVVTCESIDTCIGRAIITRAQRFRVSPEQVIQEVIEQGNPNILLPSGFQI